MTAVGSTKRRERFELLSASVLAGVLNVLAGVLNVWELNRGTLMYSYTPFCPLFSYSRAYLPGQEVQCTERLEIKPK